MNELLIGFLAHVLTLVGGMATAYCLIRLMKTGNRRYGLFSLASVVAMFVVLASGIIPRIPQTANIPLANSAGFAIGAFLGFIKKK